MRRRVPSAHRKRAPAVVVRALSAAATHGVLCAGPLRAPCALGRSGCRARKREGDGATPIGVWRIGRVLYRRDKRTRPRTRLAERAIARDLGWCDAQGDRNYNRAVKLPYPASAERMWRDDDLYDVVVVLGHNERPRVQGMGSAIFMHVAREAEGAGRSLKPTEGCIALRRAALLRLLARLGPGTRISILAGARKT